MRTGQTALWNNVTGIRLRIEQGNKLPFDNINPEEQRRGRIPLGLSKVSAFWQYQSMWRDRFPLRLSKALAFWQYQSMWRESTRTEQGNKLPFDNISPCGRNPLGLSKATSCLLTISVHVAHGVLLQRLNHSGWLRPGKESSAVRKGPAFQVILAPLWPGRVNLALFIGKSHALGVCLYLNNLTTVSQVTCMIKAWLVHTFTGKVPLFHLKVFALPGLLSNIVMLVYKLSVQSL